MIKGCVVGLGQRGFGLIRDVLLKNKDLEDCENLFAQFDLECAKTFIEEMGEIPISIARGFARFEPEQDLRFNDVFKRADNAMYENKRKIKKAQ